MFGNSFVSKFARFKFGETRNPKPETIIINNLAYYVLLFHSHPLADNREAIENRNREKKLVENGKKDLIYLIVLF
ncbi:MAG: hypothetical protein IIB05_02005 [Bacteroidetes bacterium]|nr:hypothetical protein [Bacteroidota bacterium]